MKKILWLLPLLLCASAAHAQSTTVSGTITDAGGQAWFSGSIQFRFRPSDSNPTAQYFWNGAPFDKSTTIPANPLSLDGSGSFSGVTVPSNTAIAPAGSTWTVTVCPAASVPNCFSKNLTIMGATQSISSQIIPPAVVVNLTVPLLGARAYTDAEIVGGVPGIQYFNATDNLIHVCVQTGFPPCTWTPVATTNIIATSVRTLSVNITPVTVTGPSQALQNLQAATAIAAGTENTLGKTLRFHTGGTISVAAGKIEFTFSLGTGTGNPAISGFTPGVAGSPYEWTLDGTCTTTTTGATGASLCAGEIKFGGAAANTSQDSSTSPFNFTFANANLTGTLMLQVQALFGSANGGNTATENVLTVEQMN